MSAEAAAATSQTHAPRRAGQDHGRDQHHRAGARRHVGRPRASWRGAGRAVRRCAAAGSGSRRRRQMKPSPSKTRADQQGVDAAGEGAARRLATGRAPCRAGSAGDGRSRSAVSAIAMPPSAVIRLTIDSSQPAWLRLAPSSARIDGSDGRHLADMERGDHAGRDQQADQVPRRTRLTRVLLPPRRRRV